MNFSAKTRAAHNTHNESAISGQLAVGQSAPEVLTILANHFDKLLLQKVSLPRPSAWVAVWITGKTHTTLLTTRCKIMRRCNFDFEICKYKCCKALILRCNLNSGFQNHDHSVIRVSLPEPRPSLVAVSSKLLKFWAPSCFVDNEDFTGSCWQGRRGEPRQSWPRCLRGGAERHKPDHSCVPKVWRSNVKEFSFLFIH